MPDLNAVSEPLATLTLADTDESTIREAVSGWLSDATDRRVDGGWPNRTTLTAGELVLPGRHLTKPPPRR